MKPAIQADLRVRFAGAFFAVIFFAEAFFAAARFAGFAVRDDDFFVAFPEPPPDCFAPARARLASSAAMRSSTLAGSSVVGSGDDLLAGRLLVDEREQFLAVLVVVFLGIELRGERADELARHLLLPLARFARRLRQWLFPIDREHFVGEAHRLEYERAVDRADRDQRLLRTEDETPDRDLPEFLHHVGEQAVGLGVFLVGNEVVRLLEEDRVDVGQVDEVLDLDLRGSPWA